MVHRVLKSTALSVVLLLSVFNVTSVFASEEVIKEALEEYFDLASFADGVVPAQNLSQLGDIQIIDTRQADAFEKSHIEGAINIEWRQVVFNLDKIAQDKVVVLYCDTGILSSKAHFALRLLGYENARVLMGGYDGYKNQVKK